MPVVVKHVAKSRGPQFAPETADAYANRSNRPPLPIHRWAVAATEVKQTYALIHRL